MDNLPFARRRSIDGSKLMGVVNYEARPASTSRRLSAEDRDHRINALLILLATGLFAWAWLLHLAISEWKPSSLIIQTTPIWTWAPVCLGIFILACGFLPYYSLGRVTLPIRWIAFATLFATVGSIFFVAVEVRNAVPAGQPKWAMMAVADYRECRGRRRLFCDQQNRPLTLGFRLSNGSLLKAESIGSRKHMACVLIQRKTSMSGFSWIKIHERIDLNNVIETAKDIQSAILNKCYSGGYSDPVIRNHAVL